MVLKNYSVPLFVIDDYERERSGEWRRMHKKQEEGEWGRGTSESRRRKHNLVRQQWHRVLQVLFRAYWLIRLKFIPISVVWSRQWQILPLKFWIGCWSIMKTLQVKAVKMFTWVEQSNWDTLRFEPGTSEKKKKMKASHIQHYQGTFYGSVCMSPRLSGNCHSSYNNWLSSSAIWLEWAWRQAKMSMTFMKLKKQNFF